jgi:hypothetical protein
MAEIALNSLHQAIRDTIATVILDGIDEDGISEATVDAVFQNRRFRTKMRGMIHEIIMEEAKNLDLDAIQKEIQKQQVIIKRLKNKIQKLTS